jgi:hypothetical protein
MTSRTLFPCAVCSKNVTKCQKSIYCDSCQLWTHLRCTALNNTDFALLSNNADTWFCPKCLRNLFAFNSIDDDFDFLACLFNLNSSNKINADLIKSSQQLHLTTKYKPCSSDIDPDKYFYNEVSDIGSSYYMEDEFNQMISNKLVDDNFSLLHVNARSLAKNLDFLNIYLNTLNHKFSVIVVTETWASSTNESFLTIPGYHGIFKNRPTGIGGGVAIFIKDLFSYSERSELCISNNCNIESLFIEIFSTSTNLNKRIIGVVYRPPGNDLDSFLTAFDSILTRVSHVNTECLIAGDYNIDLLKSEVHLNTDRFVNILHSHLFIPLITRPTRFGLTSSTLIDNIFTNKLHNSFVSGALIADVSDHLPIFFISQTKIKQANPKFITTNVRYQSSDNIAAFRSALANTDWDDLNATSDCNDAYNTFINKFLELYNFYFPISIKKVKCYSYNHKPWVTSGIIKSIHRKHSLYKKYISCKTEESKSKYINYKNKLTTTIRMAEKQYFSHKFEMAKGSINKTWQTINDIIAGPNTRNNKIIKEMKINDNIVTDNNILANKFNSFFANIGPSLAQKIPTVNGDISDYLTGDFQKSIFISGTDPSEIINIVKALKSSSSKGSDGISSKIIKEVINEIAIPLCTISDLSLANGQFPNKLKTAKIVPIFKSDDRLNISNYRPISVLPFFSKIFEKLMYNRLLFYLNEHHILVDDQFGFREEHSTYMALLKMIDDITHELDNKNYSLGIFIDLSKAFDTIDHKLLLKKLYHYGIRGTAHRWFSSYLEGRTQYVSVNNTNSDKLPVTCGVPQGSILGPLLFLIFINDIINASVIIRFIMFADDTNLFFKHENLNTLYTIVNNELMRISKWFKLNKLSLNIKKTNFILFRNNNKKIAISNLSIKIDDVIIEQVIKTKFLGVIINENLSWQDHIKVITNKISKNIGILHRISKNVPIELLKTLYYTLIQPYLYYCNIIWGSHFTKYHEQLFIKQKRAIRIITNSKWHAHTGPIFENLRILPLSSINKLQIYCFMFKMMHNLLPHFFQNMFKLNSEIHEHNTRQASKLHISSHHTNLRAFSIHIYGVKLWNTLSDDITNCYSLNVFKKKCLHLLLAL